MHKHQEVKSFKLHLKFANIFDMNVTGLVLYKPL